MTRRSSGLVLALVLTAGGGGGACDCGGDLPNEGEQTCQFHSDCPEGMECDPDRKICVPAFSGYCDTDEDCVVYGADMYCETEIHLCVSRHECGPDQPCPNAEQECREDPATGFRVCVYPGCEEDAECEELLAGQCGAGTRARCVLRACMCQEACGGPCGDGQVCCADTDAPTCIGAPQHCAELSCEPGFGAVADVEMPWSTDDCAYLGDQCSCRERPPLPWGDIGDPSVMQLASDGTPVFAAYNFGFDHDPVYADTRYGDLMIGRALDGEGITWTFADGVPVADIAAGPSGPRGGVRWEGDDVGQQLDMVLDASDRVHIAYWDATNGALRYARQETDGGLVVFTIDDEGEAGRYPSIALAPDGAPRVAYFSPRVSPTPSAAEARLKLAVASGPSPQAAGDFQLHIAHVVDLTALPCEGTCPEGKICRDRPDPQVDDCVIEDDPQTCGSCLQDQTCVGGVCTPIIPASLADMPPEGVGLFSRVGVRPDGSVFVLAYDSLRGDLVLVEPGAGADLSQPGVSFTLDRLDGDTPPASGPDVGTHVSLAMATDGSGHLAYVDNTARVVVYARLTASGQLEGRQVIDDGVQPGPGGADDHHRLEDPAIAARPDGSLVVAYQDATAGALWRCDAPAAASFDGCQWLLGGERGDHYRGTFGFANNVDISASGLAILSTYRVRPQLDAAYDNGVVLIDYPVAPLCREDSYEDNDTLQAATLHQALSLPGRICAGDEDWFSIDAPAGGELLVRLGFDHSAGDLDVTLHSAAGAELAASRSSTDDEELRHTVGAAGSYYIKVWGYSSASNSYVIAVDVR